MAGAGIFCLAAATRNYVYTSPRFVVRHIGVTGNTHVTADTIIRESTIFEGRNIFGLDLSEAAVAIEKIPRIRSAQVRRIPPDEIQIEVTERKPLALILSGRLLCVDREARILAEYDPAHKLDAPIISGKSLAGAKVGDTVQVEKVSCALEIVEIINRLGLAGHLRISEINVDDPDNIVLVAEQSGATILLGSDNFEAKLWRLARVAETMECNEQLKVANLERLDMRFEAIVPAKFKEAHS
jgi:cell division protein FtsQ